MTKRLLWLLVVAFLLTACELGGGVPANQTPVPTEVPLIPAQLPTATPGGLPPANLDGETNTTGQQGLQSSAAGETFGPVSVSGDFTVDTPVTVRVTRGDAVTSVNCLYVHQESGQSVVMDPPATTGPGLDGTFTETFTFTPTQGGTYSVDCTGVAITPEGLRDSEASATPFTVEVKG